MPLNSGLHEISNLHECQTSKFKFFLFKNLYLFAKPSHISRSWMRWRVWAYNKKDPRAKSLSPFTQMILSSSSIHTFSLSTSFHLLHSCVTRRAEFEFIRIRTIHEKMLTNAWHRVQKTRFDCTTKWNPQIRIEKGHTQKTSDKIKSSSSRSTVCVRPKSWNVIFLSTYVGSTLFIYSVRAQTEWRIKLQSCPLYSFTMSTIACCQKGCVAKGLLCKSAGTLFLYLSQKIISTPTRKMGSPVKSDQLCLSHLDGNIKLCASLVFHVNDGISSKCR